MEFKGTKGKWHYTKEANTKGGYTYSFYVENGHKTLHGSSPIVWGDPTIFFINAKLSYGHRGAFENE